MKQFLLLVLTALLSLSAGAQTRTFTDKLTVELGGKSGTTEPLTATVYLTEHDGKVDLELRNFVFKASSGDPLGIGNIKLSNLPLTDEGEKKSFKGTGKATLTPGTLPGVAFWMASFAKSVDMKAEGYVTADSLNFALDFQVPRMPVAMKVRFGNWAVTGLRTAVNDAQTAAVYTLDGRRLQALPARGGVYIVGGRKVVRLPNDQPTATAAPPHRAASFQQQNGTDGPQLLVPSPFHDQRSAQKEKLHNLLT